MKRALVRALVILAALLSGACATAQLGLLQRGPHKPDQEVLELFLCRGAEVEAERYLEDLGLPRPERQARIERARAAVKSGGVCPCGNGPCADPPAPAGAGRGQ